MLLSRSDAARHWWAAALLLLFGAPLTGRGQCDGPLTLDRLQRLSACQLAALYARAEVGTPPCGHGRGCLLCLVDHRRLRRVQVRLSNALWRGKDLEADGRFINCWAGGLRAIGSCCVIGSSWFDGRPAVLFDYPPGTAVFGNTHDELRAVAPGLYLGPLYACRPCPKLCGFIALQVAETGCPPGP